MKNKAKRTFLVLSLMFVLSCEEGGIMRGYCSDEPICYKYQCEDGYDNGSCERWEKHCKENPDDKDCKADNGSEQGKDE